MYSAKAKQILFKVDSFAIYDVYDIFLVMQEVYQISILSNCEGMRVTIYKI